jgi:hypothetical protein
MPLPNGRGIVGGALSRILIRDSVKPMPVAADIRTALSHFSETLTTKFALPGIANPEDQLKKPVEELLVTIGATLGKRINVRTEAQLRDERARPDMAIYVDGLICGYIELKQRNFGADPTRFREERSKKQWEKLKNLPNIIYTDGRDWTLWRKGEPEGSLFRLCGDPYGRARKLLEQAMGRRLNQYCAISWVGPQLSRTAPANWPPISRLSRASFVRRSSYRFLLRVHQFIF